MAQSPQSLKNHARFDPMFHFFLAPASLALLVWAVIHLFRAPSSESRILTAAVLILFFAIFKMRLYSLKVQDRVIRLEERLRLQTLADADLRARINQLTESQLIALRFASDPELPTLAVQALDQQLDPKQIKVAIQQWRPDYFRV